MYDNVAKSYGT